MYLKIKFRCINCNKAVRGYTLRRKFCSALCEREYTAMKQREHIDYPEELHVSKSALGAASELDVCSDLLRRGYEVFRSVNSSCSCDLIAMKDKKILRIEVKTGWRHKQSGKLIYPKPSSHNYDMFALAFLVRGI